MVPPLELTFTVAAVVTDVLESMSSTVSVGAAPFQFAVGTKRKLSVLFNVKDVDAPATSPSVVHVLPFEEYCHVPWDAFEV